MVIWRLPCSYRHVLFELLGLLDGPPLSLEEVNKTFYRRRKRVILDRATYGIALAKFILESYAPAFNPFGRDRPPRDLTLRQVFIELGLRSMHGGRAAVNASRMLYAAMCALGSPRPEYRYCDELCWKSETEFYQGLSDYEYYSYIVDYLNGKNPGPGEMNEVRLALRLLGRKFGDVTYRNARFRVREEPDRSRDIWLSSTSKSGMTPRVPALPVLREPAAL